MREKRDVNITYRNEELARTYMSSFEFMSTEKVSEMGVMASLAVFCVKSKAPVIMVVS